MSNNPKVLLTRWFEEVWNQQRGESIDELMAPTCLTKVEGMDEPLTRDTFKEYQRAFLSAVPDVRVEVLFITTEDARSIVGWRARGTHLGGGLGIPPSYRAMDFTGLSVFDLERGRIVHGFDRWNRGEMIASLMQVRIEEIQASGFTRREAEVALLIADRLTYVEIAASLGIKPNTARRYCERILTKLGVHRRQDVGPALRKIRPRC